MKKYQCANKDTIIKKHHSRIEETQTKSRRNISENRQRKSQKNKKWTPEKNYLETNAIKPAHL